MAFDESLAARIRAALARKKGVEEKKMFGGVGFLLDGNMWSGLEGLADRPRRPDEGEEALLEPHVREFDITGRPMKGWVLVGPEGVEDDDQLSLDRAGGEVRADAAGEGEVAMSRLQLAIEQIVFARNYTIGLLDQTPTDEWFRQPPGGVSHVAWQVGHIAFAEYRLAWWRIRGERPDDECTLLARIQAPVRGGLGAASDSTYPPAELRAVLDRVHQQVLQELPGLDEAELDQPVPHPHPFAKTKCRRCCGALTTRCCTPGRSACCAATWGIRRRGEERSRS